MKPSRPWRMARRLFPRAFASSDGHVVEDIGENPHVEQRILHGVADGVFAVVASDLAASDGRTALGDGAALLQPVDLICRQAGFEHDFPAVLTQYGRIPG